MRDMLADGVPSVPVPRTTRRSRIRHLTPSPVDQTDIGAHACPQAAIAELGARAVSTAELSVLMTAAATSVARTLDVEYCGVLELLPDGLRLRTGSGWKAECIGRATMDAGAASQARYTLLSNAPVIVGDLAGETRFRASALFRDHGIRSGLTVVIPGRPGPFGVMGAYAVTR